ncbi:hypothetical protein O6H91_18G081800 [Diphasiastrum complanatum]|uniref:Uncharacterized protein n=1 Tax=Diphasiastrum complanatum TaxID=34168 RepID=A0ACC2B385_DIPCM|nr:hypothetical protein O6H91_18G081800 [Diphasiastrum complanatum]
MVASVVLLQTIVLVILFVSDRATSCNASHAQHIRTIGSSSKGYGELPQWPTNRGLASKEEQCGKESSSSGSRTIVICFSREDDPSEPTADLPSGALDLLPMLPKTFHVPPAGPNPMGNDETMQEQDGSAAVTEAKDKNAQEQSNSEVKD